MPTYHSKHLPRVWKMVQRFSLEVDEERVLGIEYCWPRIGDPRRQPVEMSGWSGRVHDLSRVTGNRPVPISFVI